MSTGTALRDENNVTSKLACLNTDTVQGTNLIPIKISSTGGMEVITNGTINFTMQPVAPKDDNYVNVWLFEGTDGLTYPAVADSDGRLLVERA